ncbi:hypothetical protein [Pontibacter chitinilyticus]|uniref:hypothetical protein n=1 Tax=Pontibacter chitinilyticus TaxID=2674989 RepID=UPI00321B8012
MHQVQKYIALFLLLLFVRVMVPDALILQLHRHSHTIDKVPSDTKQAQVSAKHTHCPVEELFGAPYQGSCVTVAYQQLTHTSLLYSIQYKRSWHHLLVSCPFLRGPPAAYLTA